MDTEPDASSPWSVCLMLLLSAATAAAGCRAPSAASERVLPFHVAVLPVIVSQEQASEEVAEEVSEALRLALEPILVEQALASVLEGQSFAKVTLLRAHESDSDAAPASGADFAAEAAREGADLLLQCNVRYSPDVRTERNEKFWLNMPLFLIGGPITYFVNDRAYFGEARISARLLDLQPILAGQATLENGRSEHVYAEAAFFYEELDFIDRADGFGQYLTSIVIPVGFLAKDGDKVQKRLNEGVALQLAEGLARELNGKASALFSLGPVSEFYLKPDLRIERQGEEVVVRGDVALRTASRVQLTRFQVHSGDAVADGTLAATDVAIDGSPFQRLVSHPFEARIRAAKGALLRIVIQGVDRARLDRTYTLRIPV